MKLNREWYKEGDRHVCRTCGVKLSRLVNGELRSLYSKAHVIFLLESGSFYRVNLCKQCIENLDFTSKDVVMSIWASDIYALSSLEAKKERASDKPLIGFYMVEDRKFSMEKLEQLKERFLNARKL